MFCRYRISFHGNSREGIRKLAGEDRIKFLKDIQIKHQNNNAGALGDEFQEEVEVFVVTRDRLALATRENRELIVDNWTLENDVNEGSLECCKSFVIGVLKKPRKGEDAFEAPLDYISALGIKGKSGEVELSSASLKGLIFTAPASDYGNRSRKADSAGISGQCGLVNDWRKMMGSENLIPGTDGVYVAPRRKGTDPDLHQLWMEESAEVLDKARIQIGLACPEMQRKWNMKCIYGIKQTQVCTIRQSYGHWVTAHQDSCTADLAELIYFPSPSDIPYCDISLLPEGHKWCFGIKEAKLHFNLAKGPWTFMISNSSIHGTYPTLDRTNHVIFGQTGIASLTKASLFGPKKRAILETKNAKRALTGTWWNKYAWERKNKDRGTNTPAYEYFVRVSGEPCPKRRKL